MHKRTLSQVFLEYSKLNLGNGRLTSSLLPLFMRGLPLRHPPIRRHVNHVDLTLRRIENFVPQSRVIDRERVGLERGRDDGWQVRVVAMVQDLVEFVLRPDGTRATFLQVIKDQHGGGFNFVEAAIKRNVRGGAEGLVLIY